MHTQTMTSWVEKVRYEEPVEITKPNPIPLGWIRLKKDKTTGLTVMDQNDHDNSFAQSPVDWDHVMTAAIGKMQERWEWHHYLQGTYYDYSIQDDMDHYESEEDDTLSDSESEDEQNVHLAGGGRYYDEN